MKKFQNGFTTQEQSQRLLELGLPAESADCSLRRVLTDGGYCETWIVDVFDFIGHVYDDYLPCWSVGRLIEIWGICVHLFPGMELKFYSDSKILEQIIEEFEEKKQDGLVDLSELEQYL